MIKAGRIVSTCVRLRKPFLPVVAGLALTGTLVSAGPAQAQAAMTSIPGGLRGVSAVSASNVWAVGAHRTGTLIVHWNGRAWARVKSPQLEDGVLAGVSMVSARDGWAVGSYLNSSDYFGPLMLHWNGTKWARVALPSGTGPLYGVHMVSATNGWAVGDGSSANGAVPLALHWNGRTWSQAAVPAASDGQLYAVTARSASNAWAVGWYGITRGGFPVVAPLVLHWDGTAWTQVPSPRSGPDSELNAVSARSASNAWAVGLRYPESGPVKTLTQHWDGTAWSRVPSPSPGNLGQKFGPANELAGVATLSASNAWSVGHYTRSGNTAPLVLHWNGTKWIKVTVHRVTTDTYLEAISMLSSSDGWAVGSDGSTGTIVVLHWNGTAWSQSHE